MAGTTASTVHLGYDITFDPQPSTSSAIPPSLPPRLNPPTHQFSPPTPVASGTALTGSSEAEERRQGAQPMSTQSSVCSDDNMQGKKLTNLFKIKIRGGAGAVVFGFVTLSVTPHEITNLSFKDSLVCSYSVC